MATDDSVLMNIENLFEMEADRRADAAATKERVKAEAAARDERERRDREDALRTAREDERRRSDEEAAARGKEVEDRIQNLRAELSEVRTAREQMRLEVAAIASRPEPKSSRANWIVGAMAAVSLAAAVTATAVSWPQPIPPVDTSPIVAQVDEVAPLIEETAIAEVVVDTVDSVAGEASDVTLDERPTPRGPRGPRVGNHGNTTHGTSLGQQLDFGSGDGLIPDL